MLEKLTGLRSRGTGGKAFARFDVHAGGGEGIGMGWGGGHRDLMAVEWGRISSISMSSTVLDVHHPSSRVPPFDRSSNSQNSFTTQPRW